ncbi:hypothetical protein P691DRAFT_800036 [Macrolepiota fuliginosa MF-IS2]|uniref:Uncharacterized protein n=1 Tax=Macrolepiota fuliginosa MF-IS2 TaxID=1400762 RepID=A0A9P5XQS1_9AGAR|nr:hypothetical protein P691DRAFT_800036 [Macrolepiota fuliginosa MF-IS2]
MTSNLFNLSKFFPFLLPLCSFMTTQFYAYVTHFGLQGPSRPLPSLFLNISFYYT